MQKSLNHTLDRLLDGQNLTERESGELLAALTVPELSPVLAGALLAALRAKGVTAAELRGLAGGMRALARRPRLPTALRAIDIVGTGGGRARGPDRSPRAAPPPPSRRGRRGQHRNPAPSPPARPAPPPQAPGPRPPPPETRA